MDEVLKQVFFLLHSHTDCDHVATLDCLAHIPNIDSTLQVVRSMITPRRLSRMAGAKLSMAEALQWLCRAEPTSKDLLEALQTWTAKTPARVALAQVEHMLLIKYL